MTGTDAALFAGLLPNPASPDALGARAYRIAHAADCGAIRAAAGMLTSARRAPTPRSHRLAVRLLDKPGKRVTSTIDRDVQTARPSRCAASSPGSVPIASATRGRRPRQCDR